MNDLNPDELQNSSSRRSTRTRPGPRFASCEWTASTNGFRTTAGFTVLMVPRNTTRGPSTSAASNAEYFSSATSSGAPAAVGSGIRSSRDLERGHPKRARGVDGDVPRGPGHGELELRLEADAREAEAAANVGRRLLHRGHVVAERVGLAVHLRDPVADRP